MKKEDKYIYVGLLTKEPDSNDSNWIEADYKGYKRVPIKRTFKNWKVTKKCKVINRKPITFPECISDYPYIKAIGIFDKKGHLLFWELTDGFIIKPGRGPYFPKKTLFIDY